MLMISIYIEGASCNRRIDFMNYIDRFYQNPEHPKSVKKCFIYIYTDVVCLPNTLI